MRKFCDRRIKKEIINKKSFIAPVEVWRKKITPTKIIFKNKIKKRVYIENGTKNKRKINIFVVRTKKYIYLQKYWKWRTEIL